MKSSFASILAGCALVAISGCGGPQTMRPSEATVKSPPAAPSIAGPDQPKTLSYRRVVDLSHAISPAIPLWPGDPPVEFTTVASLDKEGYFLRKFSVGEHSATHLNAPATFTPGGATVDTHAPASLVVPAVVIDVRSATARNPDYQLTEQDVLRWESAHGQVPAGSLVLLYTGWQERWSDPKAFLNQDASGTLHFPGFGGATTTFLLQQRHIAGVGIDTHGADAGMDTSYATNKQVLASGGIVLECVTHLDQLPATGTTLVLGLLRLKGGSGTPVALTALVP